MVIMDTRFRHRNLNIVLILLGSLKNSVKLSRCRCRKVKKHFACLARCVLPCVAGGPKCQPVSEPNTALFLTQMPPCFRTKWHPFSEPNATLFQIQIQPCFWPKCHPVSDPVWTRSWCPAPPWTPRTPSASPSPVPRRTSTWRTTSGTRGPQRPTRPWLDKYTRQSKRNPSYIEYTFQSTRTIKIKKSLKVAKTTKILDHKTWRPIDPRGLKILWD